MRLKLSFLRSLQHVRLAAALVCLATAVPSASAAENDDPIELGRQLFEHKWVPNDPLSPKGDGLGPVYNADSCVACHHLGAAGGAGSAEHNVELMSLVAGEGRTSARKMSALQAKAGKIHPSFAHGRGAASTVMLHKLGTDPGYERWRLSVLGFKLPADLESKKADGVRRVAEDKQSSAPPVGKVPKKVGVPLLISRRNTTPLFGAGLIDSISEKTLLDLETRQAEQFPDLVGRVARTAGGGVGRFGWRGQVSTLREFVVSACAMELGLQNEKHPQAPDPLDPKKSLSGNDLTREQCDALTAYIASLPPPVRIKAASLKEADRVGQGEDLFESCGCIACHVRDVGPAKGIYSDLLLHDMGQELADPIPASPKPGTAMTVSEQSSGGSAYGGGGGRIVESLSPAALALRREWKTPPLWGVRDSAPYLHDGRAATLMEAILAHGGQADASVRKFRDLNFLSRSHLVDFLKTLASPASESTDLAAARR